MVKKIALNVFYNLGLIISLLGIGWAYNNEKYLVIGLFVLTGAFFLYQKIQMAKEMRSTFKK